MSIKTRRKTNGATDFSAFTKIIKEVIQGFINQGEQNFEK